MVAAAGFTPPPGAPPIGATEWNGARGGWETDDEGNTYWRQGATPWDVDEDDPLSVGIGSIAGGAGNVGGGYTQPQQWGTAGTTATTNGAANAVSGGGGYTLPQGGGGGGGGAGGVGGSGGGSGAVGSGGGLGSPVNTGGGIGSPVNTGSGVQRGNNMSANPYQDAIDAARQTAINNATAQAVQSWVPGFTGNGQVPGQRYGVLPTYGELFNQNQGVYNATMGGYQQALSRQEQIHNENRGYIVGASNRAQSMLDGIGAAAQQEIADQYAQARGQATQDLISRGLGNSTVASSVDRGLTYDQAKANVNLQNQLAAQRLDSFTHFADQSNAEMQNYGQQYGQQMTQSNNYLGNYGNLLTQLGNQNASGNANLMMQGFLTANGSFTQLQNAQQQQQAQQTAAQNAMQQQILQAQLQSQLQQQQYYMQYGGGVGDYGYYGG